MSAPDWQSRGSPVAGDPAAPAPPDRHRRTTRLFAHPARAFILSGCPPRMNHRPASVATEFFNSLLRASGTFRRVLHPMERRPFRGGHSASESGGVLCREINPNDVKSGSPDWPGWVPEGYGKAP